MANAPEAGRTPGCRTLLFSGHMIDAPGRTPPRFPAALEPTVSRAIRSEIDKLQAGRGDVGITSGACGSDILFAEAALDRGVSLRIYLPFAEPEFLDKSVTFAHRGWADRYHAVMVRSQRFVAPEALGPLPAGVDPFERTNLWMLEEARRIGGDNVSFICVWNGEGGDGPGGTKHMIDAVGETGGSVHWIDIRRL